MPLEAHSPSINVVIGNRRVGNQEKFADYPDRAGTTVEGEKNRRQEK
jgi:hypothetical protein